MSIPADLKYAKTHEWVKLDDDGVVAVGITHHAQDLLGDMVYVEMPDIGRKLAAGDECAVVESVKAAADVYAPLAGAVTAVNAELETAPEKINQDPYGTWIFKLKPDKPADMSALLDADAYRKLVESEEH